MCYEQIMGPVPADLQDAVAIIVSKKLDQKKPVVVGIGENAHGDEVSWEFRVRLMEQLASDPRVGEMVVLCEIPDFYVSDFRKKRVRFTMRDHRFTPYMVAYSDRTQIQMDAARRIAKLAQGRVYGIDIQQVDFPFMWVRAGNVVREAIESDADIKRKWLDFKDGSSKGSIRNKLNAKVISHIAQTLSSSSSSSSVGPPLFLYFAQNEHVSRYPSKGVLESSTHPDTIPYKTDGHYLSKDKRIGYVAIATHSPHLWAAWDIKSQSLLKEQLEDEYDIATSFDAVLVKKTSKRLKFM